MHHGRNYNREKSFKPWISSETKDLMDQRDLRKQRAKDLAKLNTEGTCLEEEVLAWGKFKNYRNKVNKNKKNDEYKFKRDNIAGNLDNPTTMWGTIKGFMNWKKASTPNQIVKDNILYTKARDVARVMNEFFVQKVRDIRNKFDGVAPNYEHCKKAMGVRTVKCTYSMS